MAESPLPTKYSVYAYKYNVPPNIIACEEGTLTAHAGDLVKFDSSGQLAIATSGACNGICGKTHTSTSGTTIPVELLDPANLYVIRAASGTTTAQANVGELFDITFTVDGGHTAAANTTSGVDGQIMQLHPEDGVKAGGRYIVRFLITATDFSV